MAIDMATEEDPVSRSPFVEGETAAAAVATDCVYVQCPLPWSSEEDIENTELRGISRVGGVARELCCCCF